MTYKKTIIRFLSEKRGSCTYRAISEWEILRSQIVTSSQSHGGRRYLPHVFTEQGIAMLSGILNSETAINVNIQIMRAFVEMRHYVSGQNVTEQIAALRRHLLLYSERNDKKINEIINVLNKLTARPPEPPPRRIGFGAHIQG